MAPKCKTVPKPFVPKAIKSMKKYPPVRASSSKTDQKALGSKPMAARKRMPMARATLLTMAAAKPKPLVSKVKPSAKGVSKVGAKATPAAQKRALKRSVSAKCAKAHVRNGIAMKRPPAKAELIPKTKKKPLLPKPRVAKKLLAAGRAKPLSKRATKATPKAASQAQKSALKRPAASRTMRSASGTKRASAKVASATPQCTSKVPVAAAGVMTHIGDGNVPKSPLTKDSIAIKEASLVPFVDCDGAAPAEFEELGTAADLIVVDQGRDVAMLQLQVIDKPAHAHSAELVPLSAKLAGQDEWRCFAEDLAPMHKVDAEALSALVRKLLHDMPHWQVDWHRQCVALLLACVARSERKCLITFLNEGMELLGTLLQDSLISLEDGDIQRQEIAADWAIACIACLWVLPIGRVTVGGPLRRQVGKPFDQLLHWCRERARGSYLAEGILLPLLPLSELWRRQPPPAAKDKSAGKHRQQVIKLLTQSLGDQPRLLHYPQLLPRETAAAEVEAELFDHYGESSQDYRHHARMLRTNLANPANTALRERVLSGELRPAELVAMDSRQLAPEALRQQRRELEQNALREVWDKVGPHKPVPRWARYNLRHYNSSTSPVHRYEHDTQEDTQQQQQQPAAAVDRDSGHGGEGASSSLPAGGRSEAPSHDADYLAALLRRLVARTATGSLLASGVVD